MHEASNVVYIGIQGAVLALDRSNGNEIWRTELKGSDFVNVVLDRDQLFASTSGEMFCLSQFDGRILWNNRLKGLGHGIVTMVTETGSAQLAPMREKIMRDEQAASNAATSTSIYTAAQPAN
jgi:outer membrane protein assembly factor BamB